eukprot:1194185-Prorocentrum_minimum.AAC.2
MGQRGERGGIRVRVPERRNSHILTAICGTTERHTCASGGRDHSTARAFHRGFYLSVRARVHPGLLED